MANNHNYKPNCKGEPNKKYKSDFEKMMEKFKKESKYRLKDIKKRNDWKQGIKRKVANSKPKNDDE